MDDAPLNIWSRSDEEIGRQMSHFAHTPFVLNGVTPGSVEAFYTWLFSSPSRRPKVAPFWAPPRQARMPQADTCNLRLFLEGQLCPGRMNITA